MWTSKASSSSAGVSGGSSDFGEEIGEGGANKVGVA